MYSRACTYMYNVAARDTIQNLQENLKERNRTTKSQGQKLQELEAELENLVFSFMSWRGKNKSLLQANLS